MKKIKAKELVDSAIVLLIGSYILYEMAQALTASASGFGVYAWEIFSAFFVGAVAYLRFAGRSKR